MQLSFTSDSLLIVGSSIGVIIYQRIVLSIWLKSINLKLTELAHNITKLQEICIKRCANSTNGTACSADETSFAELLRNETTAGFYYKGQ